MHCLKSALVAASLLAAVSAQTALVMPNGFANTEGNSNNAFPFNWSSSIRTQFIYDSSNFTAQGITAPIAITRLRFRADGTSGSWTGGTWSQATIQMSTCPVDHLALSNVFASNHGNDLQTVLNGAVTMQPGSAQQGVPGPWYIDIQLASPFPYDPTSGNDLTLDITLVGSSWSGGTRYQTDNNMGAGVTRLYDLTGTSPTGGVDGYAYGAICEFTCATSAGYATVSSFGDGCYDVSASFYELFGSTSSFDLAGTTSSVNSLQLIPGSGGYTVLPGSNAWFTPVSANLGLTDDSVSAAMTLPFPLVTPVGVCNSLTISSNGYVWTTPDPNSGCCNGDPIQFLAQAERFAVLWQDLNPGIGGSVHFDYDPATSGVYVTWLNVPEYGYSANVNTFQLACFASGIVEMRWMACSNLGHQVLTGWTPGNGANDPGNRDLSSAVPFVTLADAQAIALALSARPITGTTPVLTTSNIPAGTLLGLDILSHVQFNPGIDLASIGAPGCFQYTGLTSVSLVFPVGNTATMNLAIPNLPALSGVRLYSQSATLTPSANPLGVQTTNALSLLLGVQ